MSTSSLYSSYSVCLFSRASLIFCGDSIYCEAFICGSISITRTFFLANSAKYAAKFTHIVVFPTPPFIFIKAMTFFILAYPFPHTFSFIILQNAPYFYRTFAKNVCSWDSFSRSQSEHQDSNLRLGLTAHAPSRSGRCSVD